jgi:hypothetical protein
MLKNGGFEDFFLQIPCFYIWNVLPLPVEIRERTIEKHIGLLSSASERGMKDNGSRLIW